MKKIVSVLVVLGLLIVGGPLAWMNHKIEARNARQNEAYEYVIKEARTGFSRSISALIEMKPPIAGAAQVVSQLEAQVDKIGTSSESSQGFDKLLKQRVATLSRGAKASQKAQLANYVSSVRGNVDGYRYRLVLREKYRVEAQKSGLRSAFDRFLGYEE
jgi:hypothetical protein